MADDYRAEVQANLFFQANSKKGAKVPRFFDHDPAPTKPRAAGKQTRKQMDASIQAFFYSMKHTIKSAASPEEPQSDAEPDK